MYTLDLPKDAKIHPRFHISLLEPADLVTLLQRTFSYEADQDNEFEVEKILDHRGIQRSREYLIKWKGYPNTENTWEPEIYLSNCKQVLREYRKRIPKNHRRN
jgi:hypothetical protein